MAWEVFLGSSGRPDGRGISCARGRAWIFLWMCVNGLGEEWPWMQILGSDLQGGTVAWGGCGQHGEVQGPGSWGVTVPVGSGVGKAVRAVRFCCIMYADLAMVASGCSSEAKTCRAAAGCCA